MNVATAVFLSSLYFKRIKGAVDCRQILPPRANYCWKGNDVICTLCVSAYAYRRDHTVSLITWRALFCRTLTQCGHRRVFQLNVIFLGIALYKMFHHTAILKPDSGCLDNIK